MTVFRVWLGYTPLLYRHLQDDIGIMWEANVVAAQVEPYVTDYGIDTVSDDFLPFPHRASVFKDQASSN